MAKWGISSVLAALFLGGAFVTVPLQRTLSLAVDPPRAVEHMEARELSRKAFPAIGESLSLSDLAAQLRDSRLEMSAEEFRDLVASSFHDGEVEAKAREVMADLRRHVRTFPTFPTEPTAPPFHISVSEERPVLARALGDRLEAKLLADPPCGVRESVSLAWGALTDRLGGGRPDEELLRGLPDCRPPGILVDPLVERLSERMGELARDGPDRVQAFPRGEAEGSAAYVRGMATIHSLDLWLVREPARTLAVASLLLVLLLGAAVAAPMELRTALAGGLLLASGAVAVAGLLLVFFLGEPELYGRLVGLGLHELEEPSEERTLWMEVVAYAVRQLVVQAGRETLIVAGVLLVVGAGLFIPARRGSDEDLP